MVRRACCSSWTLAPGGEDVCGPEIRTLATAGDLTPWRLAHRRCRVVEAVCEGLGVGCMAPHIYVVWSRGGSQGTTTKNIIVFILILFQ